MGTTPTLETSTTTASPKTCPTSTLSTLLVLWSKTVSSATTTVDLSGHSSRTTTPYMTSASREPKSLLCIATDVISAPTRRATTPSALEFATGTTSLMVIVAPGAQSGVMMDVSPTEAAKLNLSLKK